MCSEAFLNDSAPHSSRNPNNPNNHAQTTVSVADFGNGVRVAYLPGADPVYMDLKELFHSIMFLANETPNNLVNLEYMPNLSKKNTKMAGFALSRIYFNSGTPALAPPQIPVVAMNLVKKIRLIMACPTTTCHSNWPREELGTEELRHTVFRRHLLAICTACYYVACRTLVPDYKYTLRELSRVFDMDIGELRIGFHLVVSILNIKKTPDNATRFFNVGGIRYMIYLPTVHNGVIVVACRKDAVMGEWYRTQDMDEMDVDAGLGVNIDNLRIN